MASVSYDEILYEQRGDVALITLNRPDKLNAWTRRMHGELTDAVTMANADRSVGAMVFTGAGRGFCAGADIGSQFQARIQTGREADADAGTDRGGNAGGGQEPAVNWVNLVRASKPMVAALNGAAIGVGLTLALPMDQLIAADNAKISARFVKMGLVPELASSHFLVQRCGWGAASDLALSGRMVSGAEAAAMGLVDRACPADQVLDTALGLAAEYAANPDPQLRMIKQLLTVNGAGVDLDEVQRREMAALHEAYATPEHHEAVAAFMEKRTPTFR
ncbi:MAG: enoyl-CoA hydratase/isomerase family protein [Acidimicrobiales bacterium]